MKISTTYGHGTENDFFLIFDPNDEIALDSQQVRSLCSRSTGSGADGVIKIVRRGDEWFMDYRNSDGSIA